MATYTSAATGLWSAGSTWVGGVKPPSGAGHKIVVAAVHTVTFDEASGTYGDDTSSATASSNAIVVNGVLKFSSSVSTSLTCRGTLAIAGGGSLIIGTTASPIPSGVTSALILNDSATPGIGKHGLAYLPGASTALGSVAINGRPMRRVTTMTAPASAGATSILVSDALGWEVGDSIVAATPNNDPANSQKLTVSSVAGNVVGFSATPLALGRSSGCKIVNLSSNVVIKASSATYPTFISLYSGSATSGFRLGLDITNGCRIENIGCPSWVTGGASVQYMGMSISSHAATTISKIASEWTHSLSTVGSGSAFVSSGLNLGSITATEFAHYAPLPTSGWGLSFVNGSNASFDVSILNSFNGVIATSGGALGAKYYGSSHVRNLTYQPNVGMFYATADAVCSAAAGCISANQGTLNLIGGSLSGSRIFSTSAYAQGLIISYGTTYDGSISAANTAIQDKGSRIKSSLINGDPDDNRDINYWRTCTTDLVNTNVGREAVKITANIASAAIPYTFDIPVTAGVSVRIIGSLMYDATYSNAAPPSISISGSGLSMDFTAGSTSGVWHDFDLSGTPAATGTATATVTINSVAVGGVVTLDGVYHDPMIRTVRRWGYQWLPQANQVVDARITLTRSAALALPVSVDHDASTVTISGVLTPSEAMQAMLADLTLPANRGRAVHCTGDGSTFETTYVAAFAGAGAVTGPYTDAVGRHVAITSSALAAGTLVQLWDVAASAELYIGTPAGALSLPIVYPGTDKTLRLRAMRCGATSASLFVEQLGTLTSAGASFLATQSPDPVYAANGIDGSTVTGITIDDTHLLIELSGSPVSVGGVMVILVPCPSVYAYETYWLSTVAGIRDEGRIIHAVDTANYLMTGFKLKNVSGYPALLTNGWMRDSVTGETATLIDFSGDPIFSHPDAVVAYGQNAATPAEIWAHSSRTLTADPGASGHAATQAAVAALPVPPAAAAVATATRAEIAPELSAILQCRDMAEADATFVPGATAGSGTLTYLRRGTATPLIPPKSVVGTSQAEASGATQ